MAQFMETALAKNFVVAPAEFEIAKQKFIQYKNAFIIPFVIVGLIFLTFVPASRPIKSATVNKTNIIQLTNYQRVINGLDPLTENPLLSEAARLKALDMIEKGYFAHYYEQTTPWDFLDKTGVTNWYHAGENLAKNYNDSTAMVQAWMDSEKHRENILSDNYSETGVAVVQATLSDGQTVSVTVQMFTGN